MCMWQVDKPGKLWFINLPLFIHYIFYFCRICSVKLAARHNLYIGGGDIMESILGQIANLGFPIVLSIYLLVRVEGKLEKLSESINELSRTIASIEPKK